MTKLFSPVKISFVFFDLLLFLLIANTPVLSNHREEIIPVATDSIRLLNEKLTADFQNNTLRLLLAEVYMRQEMFDEAEEEFRKLTEVDFFAVRAFTGCGKTHFYETPSRIIPLERLKELLKIDHRSKAIKEFKQALELDAEYLPARYFLARSYLKKDDKNSLENAEQEFNAILLREPDYKDIIYQLGFTYQKMENFQKSLEYFNQISETQPDYSRARIRMSEVYYELNNSKMSTECYFSGMKNLTDEEILDYLFEEQKMLLTKDETREMETTEYPQKGKLFVRFWKSRDPDPSIAENERLMEHFRRLKFAREHYHFTAPPYYDDRGKIYIKYGEPDARYHSSIENIPAKDNESWSYESIEEGLVFDFVADGTYYRQVQDLTEAAMSGYSYDQKVMLAGSLYFERSHLSRTYSRLATGFTMDRLHDLHAVRTKALDKYPVEIYTPADAQKMSFPFITKWGQFKADSNKTRVEFYTSFPGMALKLDPDKLGVNRNIDFFVEINDSNFMVIYNEQKRMTYQVNNPQQLRNHQFIFQNSCQLDAGQYSAAFVINDVESANKGIQRRNLFVQDYTSDELALSSLQLSEKIKPATDNTKDVFVKNGLAVNPYTFTRVLRNQPIYLYFEIYNLSLNMEGNTNYEVAYSLETTEPQRNLWQKIFGGIGRLISGGKKNIITTSTNRMGDSKDAFEYIAFDLKNLDRGKTVLKVEIRDRTSRQVVASEIEMILID